MLKRKHTVLLPFLPVLQLFAFAKRQILAEDLPTRMVAAELENRHRQIDPLLPPWTASRSMA